MSRELFRVAGSTARVLYYNTQATPERQVRRLETVLADIFPAGCGVAVHVAVSWHEAGRAWEVLEATVEARTRVDMTDSLYESFLSNGLPMMVR